MASTIVQVVMAVGALMGGAASAIATTALLDRKRAQAKADIGKTKAEGDAIAVVAAGGVIEHLRGEVDRLSQRLAAQESRTNDQQRRLNDLQRREWVWEANVATLRQALIDAGVPVPVLRELRPMNAEEGDHPRRRVSDYVEEDDG
jgi:hypothetical protein